MILEKSSVSFFTKIKNFFLGIKRFFDVVIPLFPIAFLILSLAWGIGVVWANVLSLILSIAYYIFHLYVTFQKADKELKKKVKKVYKFCRRLIKLLTLVISLYGLFASMSFGNILPLLLNIFSLIGLVLQFILDIALFFIERYIKLLKKVVQNKFQHFKNPTQNDNLSPHIPNNKTSDNNLDEADNFWK